MFIGDKSLFLTNLLFTQISEMEEENEELKKQLTEEGAKNDASERREIERQQEEEQSHDEEIQALKRTKQQLRVPFSFMATKYY